MALLWLAITYWVGDHVFFWDTIQLASKHAHWYYEQNFAHFLLPAEFDSGHPPAFGMYIALIWKCFGKTLAASHFAMLPFIWASLYALLQLGRYWLSEKDAYWAMLLPFSFPVWHTQCILVSPDVVVVAGFLLVLLGILKEQRFWIVLGAGIMAIISTRGMMIVAALALFDFLRIYLRAQEQPKTIIDILKQIIPAYLPAGLLAATFLIYHYTQAGWIGYHADSPWAVSFSRVSFTGFIKNIAVLGFKLLELGFVFTWLSIVLAFWWMRQHKLYLWSRPLQDLYLLIGVLSACLLPLMLLHNNLLAHRYLLPIYLVILFIAISWIFKLQALSKPKGYFLLLLIGVGLWTGNLWRYPDQVAYGWDSSLAHLPHYQLRADMLDSVRARNIPLREIGTAFPEIGPLKYKDLSDETVGYAPKDLAHQQYILHAQSMNDFTDEELLELKGSDWAPVVELEQGGLVFTLYERRGEGRGASFSDSY